MSGTPHDPAETGEPADDSGEQVQAPATANDDAAPDQGAAAPGPTARAAATLSAASARLRSGAEALRGVRLPAMRRAASDSATPAGDGAAARRRIDPLLAGAAALVVLCVGGGLLHALLPDGRSVAAPAPTASAAPKPAPTAAPAPEPTPTPTVVGHAAPADCAGLYTRDWAPDMDGLVLNPEWAAVDAAGVWASNDEVVAGLANAATELVCRWADSDADTGIGIVTKVVRPSAPQQEAALARMNEAGYDCYEELGGTRCIAEFDADAGWSGDSHFFRDGLWLATRWVSLAPEGYTHDMITAVYGG